MQCTARRWAARILVALVALCGACSLIIDHNSAQCASDSDCARFGSHPFCSHGVCVASGLGPSDCFFGTPQKPQDLLNQCSTAQCGVFDDCARLNVCDGGLDVALLPPDREDTSSPPVDAGTSPDEASTSPSCADPTQGRTQMLYMTGSSYFPPLLAKLAPLLVSAGYTPVYRVTNSCTGVRSIFGSQPSDHLLTDPPPGSGASAAYYGADGIPMPCSVGADGVTVDVGESDIFSSSCAGFGPPGGDIGEFLGPVQSMVFVVPAQSKQTAISAAAAKEVFGMGGNHGVAAPWTDPSLYFVRNPSTGTQQIIGHAISVPADVFWGVDRGSPANIDKLLRVIQDPSAADKAIGILASDTFDQDRSNLHALAFKASGQECAYLPDSNEFRMDKQNVRDGHYPIWGPLHFFTNVSNGIPVSPAAQAFVSVVNVPNISQQLIDAFIASSLIPDCAMRVRRTTELGPLSPYTPPFQCTCYFEKKSGGSAPSGCTPCGTSDDCDDPKRPSCNLGFCEAQ